MLSIMTKLWSVCSFKARSRFFISSKISEFIQGTVCFLFLGLSLQLKSLIVLSNFLENVWLSSSWSFPINKSSHSIWWTAFLKSSRLRFGMPQESYFLMNESTELKTVRVHYLTLIGPGWRVDRNFLNLNWCILFLFLPPFLWFSFSFLSQ